MVSTFTPNKQIEQPEHNDYIDSWDVPVNADWAAIDSAFGGSGTINLTGLSGNRVLVNVPPAAPEYRPLRLILSGVPIGAVTVQMPSGVGGLWAVYNTTTAGTLVRISSLAGGSTIEVPASGIVLVTCDGTASGMVPVGTNSLEMRSQTFTNVTDIDFLNIPSSYMRCLDFTLTMAIDPMASSAVISTKIWRLGSLLPGANYDTLRTVTNGNTLTVTAIRDTATTFINLGTFTPTMPVNGKLWLTGIADALTAAGQFQIGGRGGGIISPYNIGTTGTFSFTGSLLAGAITGVRFSSTANVSGSIIMTMTR